MGPLVKSRNTLAGPRRTYTLRTQACDGTTANEIKTLDAFADTIYTERYMSLLEDNIVNYKNASLLTHAEKLRNKKYMVIHGTYDDNVHYQQSMMLSYELERRVILFRQQVSVESQNDERAKLIIFHE